MKPEDYKRAAIRTENTPGFIVKHRFGLDLLGPISPSDTAALKRVAFDQRLSRIMHAILGMITELGELCDPVKRHLIYNAPLDFNSNEKGSVREETGDRAWYDALFLDAIDARLEDIWERNIAKLRARFPDKFSEDKAVNRDLEAEGKALRDRGDWTNIDGDKTNNTRKTADVVSYMHEHHIMEAMTRVAHRLGIDAPRELVSSTNKRLADLCIAEIDSMVRERFALQNAVDGVRKLLR